MFQMNPSRFKELLPWVVSSILKCSKFHDVATLSERFCITLRYLAIGDTQARKIARIASCYRVSHSVVSKIIRNTCDAI